MNDQSKDISIQDNRKPFSPLWVNKANLDLGTVPEYQTSSLPYHEQLISLYNLDTNDLATNTM